MRRVILPLALILCFLVSFSIAPVAAQDPQYTCDSEAFLGAVSKAAPTGDLAANQKLIDIISDALRKYRMACSDYKWQGAGNNITDLFELPEGVYRAEFKVKDNFVGVLEVITGKCSMSPVTQLEKGAMTLSQLIRSDGCTAVLQLTSFSPAPWEVVIIPLK